MQFRNSCPVRANVTAFFFFWPCSSLTAHLDAPGAWKSHKHVKEIGSKLGLQALSVSPGESTGQD